ncbi:MAG: flagellar motor switch protein FliN [Desulfovibrio desulfuricans]|jgi:flagellar motor switch protein FliN/FliY|uniref:flagellar motor switch protein FliN n=1 Tax=uncultured Desulfovibrio sp. TaxID=167968 RepID=UPI001B148826|nr:flagellar motor switch protein FliN [uncultured Desulfovibrio sp.]MBE6441803.1 flagellar motor switch protein FliN [Desulfovibrio desulfuricans]MBO5490909.1 flagellar motor switch protein FliN [Desulfovibrio sp.]
MSQEDQEALAAQWAAALEEDGNAPGADSGGGEAAAAAPAGGGTGMDDEALAAQWAEALAQDEESKSGPEAFGGAAAGSGAGLTAQAEDAHFQDMTEMARQPKDNKLKRELDFILDIPLDVSAELGRTRLLINELLQLGQGSVVELNKLAGEPLEVFVNGKLVARGEAVVINEKFGVRLTDIISPIERVKQLG